MSTAPIVKHEGPSLARVDAFRFTEDQRRLILDVCCGGASREEAEALVAVAEMRGLNPISQECYFVQRWDSAKNRKVWAVQVSIDAMRIKAEESGVYSGQDEPEYEYGPDKTTPTLARVRVYRRDWDRPCVAVARYSEYVQKTRDGAPTKFWKDMPHNQLAKCAEALALRKAFPSRLAKLYTADEMAQAANDAPAREELSGEVVPPPARLAPAQRPPSTPPPAMDSGQEAAHNELARRLTLAGDEAQLKQVWKEALAADRAGRLSLSSRAALTSLRDQRRAAMKAAPPPTPAEVLGDNDFDPSFDGARAEPPVGPRPWEVTGEPCMQCGKPVGSDRVQCETADGEILWKHTGCSVFAK